LNNVLSFYSASYTAPTALGIKQKVKQIRTNAFYQRFYFCYVLNVFKTFLKNFCGTVWWFGVAVTRFIRSTKLLYDGPGYYLDE